MVNNPLDFEKPVIEIEEKIKEIKLLYNKEGKEELLEDIKRLEKKVYRLRKNIFGKLSAWQKTQIARHIDRPYTLDFINMLFEDFIELHGDRRYADDPAIVAGLGWFQKIPVVIIGHQKGRDMKERVYRNFGQPHPEGYRKALRVMKIAERFSRPVITFIDTSGAYPGIGAEERGQAEAIATNLLEMSSLKTPIISVIIGEGGSGGALALACADRVLMLEHAIYSVISPEGCAAILWKKNEHDVGQKEYEQAAEALRLTAQDLLSFGVIHEIIPEPLGGAHRNYKKIAMTLKKVLLKHLKELLEQPIEQLLSQRYDYLRNIGKLRNTKTF
ncbi:MAG: acetyl-CoA carboxylase carboxyltransferase subunit alpha [Nitrospirae bacterium]|nr:MAG: acetyl-CoA carboxylase carboxyltransferase subunit alpha [Nitrospirota bacterium]